MTPPDTARRTRRSRPKSRAVAGQRGVRAAHQRYRDADTATLLAGIIRDEFAGQIALVSSFEDGGGGAAASSREVEPSTPIIFLDTDKLFGETRRYRDQLTAELRLSDVRTIKPDPERIDALDPDGVLWYGNPDMCCRLRKVEPLQRARLRPGRLDHRAQGLSGWRPHTAAAHRGQRR